MGVRTSIVVGLVLMLGCSGGGAGVTDSSDSSSNADGANTGPVSESSGEATGETGETTGEPEEGTAEGETAGSSGGDGCPERAPLGVWVWQQDVVKDVAETALLLEFAAARGVTHVYVESEALVVQDPVRLEAFVAEADEACVAVELLFGAADWTHTENHGVALALVEAGLEIDGAAGLHFDVEPHGLDDWAGNEQEYAGEYLDLLEAMSTRLVGSELELTVDVAFWYDTVMIERDEVVRPLSELVQDRVDRVVLMDYRDHAEPPDGIIDNAATEIAYAGQVGGRVRVGVETTCGIEPEKVTFCEEGSRAMLQALATTTEMFVGSPGWDGVAVHDHAAWSVLLD